MRFLKAFVHIIVGYNRFPEQTYPLHRPPTPNPSCWQHIRGDRPRLPSRRWPRGKGHRRPGSDWCLWQSHQLRGEPFSRQTPDRRRRRISGRPKWSSQIRAEIILTYRQDLIGTFFQILLGKLGPDIWLRGLLFRLKICRCCVSGRPCYSCCNFVYAENNSKLSWIIHWFMRTINMLFVSAVLLKCYSFIDRFKKSCTLQTSRRGLTHIEVPPCIMV